MVRSKYKTDSVRDNKADESDKTAEADSNSGNKGGEAEGNYFDFLRVNAESFSLVFSKS